MTWIRTRLLANGTHTGMCGSTRVTPVGVAGAATAVGAVVADAANPRITDTRPTLLTLLLVR